MRDTVLFIGMSLDGYIADSAGGVDWMKGDGSAVEDAGSYAGFLQSVDTVVMGGRTYRQITEELSPEAWVYSGLKSYVVTRTPGAASKAADEITFTREPPCALVRRLRQEEGKAIWICGGAEIARQLMREDLIDRYHISVLPVLLGGGTRLFGGLEKARVLRLEKTQSYNGITDLVYRRR